MIAKWLDNFLDKRITERTWDIIVDGLIMLSIILPAILFFAFLEHDRIETKKINDACRVQLKNGATSCPNIRRSSATYLTKKQRRLKRLGRPY